MKALIIDDYAFTGDFVITHTQFGFDELDFTVYNGDDVFTLLSEEKTVKYGNKLFSIKSQNDNGKYVNCECLLDLSELEQNIIKEIGTSEAPLSLTLTQVFENYCPDSWEWTVASDVGVTADWQSEMLTFKDVLKSASEAYNAHFDFDFDNKTISAVFIDNIEYSGNYVTDQLNIISSNRQGDTYELCTRLYYYGKDEDNNYISIADVNDGKEYVEDFSYTDKIIAKAMVDNDTQDKSKLLQNAYKTLSSMCMPSSSYTFQVSRLTGDDYALPNLKINELVKYLDRRHKREIMHRIVEYKEHPNSPLSDEITLSTTATTIEDEVTQISNSISSNSSVIVSEASKDALNIVKNYAGTGYARLDQNRIIITNKLPVESATGLFMLDKWGFWWNDHFAEHTIDENGNIQITSWTKIIDINTGEGIWQN